MGSPEWDVFVSYSRTSDAGAAHAIADALRAAGLKVFWDDRDVRPFESISKSILAALRSSRVVLAFYSHEYPHRRACQQELTTAYLAGQREGTPSRRVVVVNPEAGAEHIHPVQLRDARHMMAPRSRQDLERLAAAVVQHVQQIEDPIGDVEPTTPPGWLTTSRPPRPPRFVGRMIDLWQLHSALHPHEAVLTVDHGDPIAVVHGPPGIGKSALVAEYAHRFGAVFTGGICWLDATDVDRLTRQLSDLTGVRNDHPPSEPEKHLGAVAAFLGLRNGPVLWILDGVPPELDLRVLQPYLRPSPTVHTVVTSRNTRAELLGQSIALGELELDDVRQLLDHPRVDEVVQAVGGHPAALALLEQEPDHGLLAETLLLDRPTKLVELVEDYLSAEYLADAYDSLLTVAALQPAPTPISVLHRTAGGQHVNRGALETLSQRGLVQVAGDRATAARLIGHLVRAYTPVPRRLYEIRGLALRFLTSAEMPDNDGPAASAHTNRSFAWKLQVELAHRVGVVGLPQDSGSIREALQSLCELFLLTRKLAQDCDPASDQGAFVTTVSRLLEKELRPFLGYWHPCLLEHEAGRADADVIAHERSWARYQEFRSELDQIRPRLITILGDLAVLTGSNYGLPDEGSTDPGR